METLLEQQRRAHEERERLIDAMTKEMLHNTKSQREQINSDHRLKALLDRCVETSSKLKDLYDDKDGQRKEEIQALSGPHEMVDFYQRLRTIRLFHHQHPNEIAVPMCMEFDAIAKARENPAEDTLALVEFTDEEGYGKYLDLHECYNKFINLKGIHKNEYISYVQYLSSFDHLFDIPKEKKNAAYSKYLHHLLEYLESYVTRIKPLMDIPDGLQTVQEQFDQNYSAGTFPGWPSEVGGAMTKTGAHLDLSAFSGPEELASLGLNRLKSALMALGLKCGGTLEQRAHRLFMTKGKKLEDLDADMFAKSKAGVAAKGREADRQKEIASLEAQVYYLVEVLGEQRVATKENVQRKQARTGEEREDSDDEGDDGPDSDGEDDEIPYNPKNLPLGWDNKPIPYWLYKLHGLNIYYSCEVCGNATYRGPKAFQRHFAEWRHAHGMRCLGIPNTAHFANVTSIEDAMSLWNKIKSGKESARWRPEAEEEYEDNSGNVVNKKIYEDLKRQGLL